MINGFNDTDLINNAMRIDAKQVARFIFPVMFTGMLLLAACENDLNKIKEISAKQINLPVDTFRNVNILYSDSAKVKFRVITPLLIYHHIDTAANIDSSFYVMPKGVKVIAYETGKESGNIVSDLAYQRDMANVIEFHHNVVATSADGGTYKSDQLIWDQNKQIIYSNKPVEITTPAGDVVNGVNFKSDDKLNNPTFNRSTGVFMVTDSASQ